MFCGKCGAKNESGAAFCYACGAPLKTAEGPAAESGSGAAPAAPQNSGRNRKIGIVAVAVVVILAAVGIFSLFGGGRGPEETAEKLFAAMIDEEPEAIVDLLPQSMVETAIEQDGYSKAELAKELDEMVRHLDSSFSNLATALIYQNVLGDGTELSYNVLDSESVSSNHLKSLQEQYSRLDVDISAARMVDVELHLQNDNKDFDESMTFHVPVIKVGSSWYLNLLSLG